MTLSIIQVIISIILIVVILIQQKGTGLGAAFGGEGNVYRTKRGLEKSLHILTIILAIVFMATSLANVIL
jgi:preprotein translocase subunit SecG